MLNQTLDIFNTSQIPDLKFRPTGDDRKEED